MVHTSGRKATWYHKNLLASDLENLKLAQETLVNHRDYLNELIQNIDEEIYKKNEI